MAVYTEVNDEDLSAFIGRYGIGELVSYKGIAEGVENTNYLVQTTVGRFILTLYEKRVATADLPFFLGLMEHLSQRGFSCPTPLRDGDGRNLSHLAGKTAALVSFLDGFAVRKPKPVHCAEVGAALARMHRAADGFGLQRVNALGQSGWRPLFERFAGRAGEIAVGLDVLIRDEIDHLDAHWPTGLPSGVIHADLFPDNAFFFHDDLSGVIDFYFACNDALAYDIAICLNAWCFEADYAFNHTKGRALLDGYQRVRALSRAEKEAMPLLARGAALRFLLTRSYDWLNRPEGALVKPHNPIDYVRRLRFHQGVTGIAGYGLQEAAA